MAFALSFARDNCRPCVAEGEEPSPVSSSELLEFSKTACVENQCVLVATEDPGAMGGAASR